MSLSRDIDNDGGEGCTGVVGLPSYIYTHTHMEI